MSLPSYAMTVISSHLLHFEYMLYIHLTQADGAPDPMDLGRSRRAVGVHSGGQHFHHELRIIPAIAEQHRTLFP